MIIDSQFAKQAKYRGIGGSEVYMYLEKTLNDVSKIHKNLAKQGKSKEQIKQAIGLYLDEQKKKINPNGDLDII